MSCKTGRPLKYETQRPVSAVISVKHRPPAATRRKVQSAAVRRTQRTDIKPDMTRDYVTGHKLTTTPDDSDVEDAGKNHKRVDAWRGKGRECADKHEDRKNMSLVERRNDDRVDMRKTRAPECVGGLEQDVQRTRLMEDSFRQQVLQLQQQLGLTAQGYVLPP